MLMEECEHGFGISFTAIPQFSLAARVHKFYKSTGSDLQVPDARRVK
jgi:hypothetical protein